MYYLHILLYIITEVISHENRFHRYAGGFVAQSPASHMPYLRDWTKDTNAPILSVEYRLAPEVVHSLIVLTVVCISGSI